MPRKKMEQFNSSETADGALFHLGTAHLLVLLRESHTSPQLHWHILWSDESTMSPTGGWGQPMRGRVRPQASPRNGCGCAHHRWRLSPLIPSRHLGYVTFKIPVKKASVDNRELTWTAETDSSVVMNRSLVQSSRTYIVQQWPIHEGLGCLMSASPEYRETSLGHVATKNL